VKSKVQILLTLFTINLKKYILYYNEYINGKEGRISMMNMRRILYALANIILIIGIILIVH